MTESSLRMMMMVVVILSAEEKVNEVDKGGGGVVRVDKIASTNKGCDCVFYIFCTLEAWLNRRRKEELTAVGLAGSASRSRPVGVGVRGCRRETSGRKPSGE